mmetsp:Transcript_23459/g.23660  ORF Transcript_23459/g.23660 Transcript_23459/m.23660 type:complete len:241 (+) Transcript_23459:176-898(+)
MYSPPSYDDARNMGRAVATTSAAHTLNKSNVIQRENMREVRLYEDTEEKNKIFEMAVLFSIFKATEAIEKIYNTGEISYSDYQRECNELISHFDRSQKFLLSQGWISSIDQFVREYDVQCPRAYSRLMKEGTPIEKDDRGAVVVVADTVQAFINAKDCLDLNERAADKVQPYIQDLITSLKRMIYHGLPSDFIGIIKGEEWLDVLNRMEAHDDLSEKDSRQLTYDLEKSYNDFKAHLTAA